MKDGIKTVRDALHLYHDGDYTRARMLLETLNVEELGGEMHAEVYYLWGLVLMRQGDATEAQAMFRKSTLADPRFFPSLDAWGNVLAGIGDARGAIDKYKRALAVAKPGQDDHTLYNYGQVLFHHGYVLRALRRFRDAFRRKRREDPAHMIGRCLIELKRPERGEKWMRIALSLNPESTRNLAGVGQALCEQGKNDEGFTFFDRAIEHDPTIVDPWFNASHYMLRDDRLLDAVKKVREGRKHCPESFELVIQEMHAMRRMGAVDKALDLGDVAKHLLDDTQDRMRVPEFMDLLYANRSACLREVNQQSQARSDLIVFIRSSMSACKHSLNELRWIGGTRQTLNKYEVTLRINADILTEQRFNYGRTCWVYAEQAEMAQFMAMNLEREGVVIVADSITELETGVENVLAGVIERTPAIPL